MLGTGEEFSRSFTQGMMYGMCRGETFYDSL